jgi:hypothetical protein
MLGSSYDIKGSVESLVSHLRPNNLLPHNAAFEGSSLKRCSGITLSIVRNIKLIQVEIFSKQGEKEESKGMIASIVISQCDYSTRILLAL